MYATKAIPRVAVGLLLALGLAACGGTPQSSTPEPNTSTAAEASAPASIAAAASNEPAPAAEGEQVTLLVWDQHAEGEGGAADKVYADFMAKHPNIKIQREITTLDQLRATASTALASGTGPDVIYHDVTPGRELSQAGLLLPLDEFAADFGWRDRFFPAGLQWTISDGKITGLGLEYEFVGVFYNRTLIEQAGLMIPQTLDQTLAFCQQSQAQGKVPFAFPSAAGWPHYFSFTMPVHNVVGVDAMAKLLFEGQGSWNTPEMVEAVNVFYRRMRDAGCFGDLAEGLDWDGARDLMYTGEALAIPTGTWIVGDLLANADPSYEWELTPFPSVRDGQRVYTAGMGSAYFISAATEHPREAAQFLDYLFSDEAVKVWIEDARFTPPVPADTAAMELPPLFKFVVDTLQDAGRGEGGVELGYNVDLLVPEEFNTMMRDGFQAVLAGAKTPEQQLADLQELWEQR